MLDSTSGNNITGLVIGMSEIENSGCLMVKSNWAKAFFLVLITLLVLPSKQVESSESIKYTGKSGLLIWAYAGQGKYLDRAKVMVKDSVGRIIGKAMTGPGGGAVVIPKSTKKMVLPLRVSVTGGYIYGKKFDGSLRALITDPNAGGVTYVDLITTAATALSSGSDYAHNIIKARGVFGVSKYAPSYFLRVRNKYIDDGLLESYIEKKGGYAKFIRSVVHDAKKGVTIEGLKPLNHFERLKQGKANPFLGGRVNASKGFRESMATSSSAPTCNVPVGNGSGSSTSSSSLSDTIIQDFGNIGLGYLFDALGTPELAQEGVAGLLFGAIGVSDGTNDDAAIQQVQGQLDCISEQLVYIADIENELITEGLENELQTALQGPDSCASSIQNAWGEYEYYVKNASSKYPLNKSNGSFANAVKGFKTSYNQGCPATLVNGIFGTSGGEAGAWNLFNQYYQSSNPNFYTAVQVQQLQTFLSYWSTMVYQQSVLISEYNGYNGYTEANSQAFGLVNGSCSKSGSGPVSCDCASTASDSPTSFCVISSAFSNAFPTSIYSDEIAFLTLKTAISPYPGGLAASSVNGGVVTPSSTPNLGPAGLNSQYILSNYYTTGQYNGIKFAYNSNNGSIYPLSSGLNFYYDKYVASAINAFNSLGINPGNLESAVQYYYNPQISKSTQAPTSVQLSPYFLNSNGGTNAVDVLYSILSGEPSGASTMGGSDSPPWASPTVSYFPNYMANAIGGPNNMTAAFATADMVANIYPVGASGQGAQTSMTINMGIPNNFVLEYPAYAGGWSYDAPTSDVYCGGSTNLNYEGQLVPSNQCSSNTSMGSFQQANYAIAFILGRPYQTNVFLSNYKPAILQ